MFTKMITMLTALPITLALSGNVNALGVSDAAKARKEFCNELAKIKDPKDPNYILKQFCDRTTFHCTTHRKGGIFAPVKGVCDDPNLCKNPIIREACESQCLDKRSSMLGGQDKKTEKIKEKLTTCPVDQKLLGKTQQPGQEIPVSPSRRDSMIQQQPSVISPVPMVEEPMVQQPQRRDSMVGSRRNSMIQQQPSVISPVPMVEEPMVQQPQRRDSMVGSMTQEQSSFTQPPPPPPLMTNPGMVPPPPSLPPEGYKPKPVVGVQGVKTQQQQPKVQTPETSQPQDLLSAIRKGHQLKKAEDRVLPEPKVTPQKDMGAMMFNAMEERRKAMKLDEKDDEEEDNNNDDWE